MRTLLSLVTILLMLGASAVAQEWGNPVWADEFNQPAGSRLDPAKWIFEIGNLRVNNELEIYCPGYPSDKEQSKPRFDAGWQEISVCNEKDGNVSFDGEHLILRAVQRDGQWTSGRINTDGKQTFQYGRMEARIKLPFGAGIWPAFWALGDDTANLRWPRRGEIDVMENVPEHGGLGPNRIRSTIHGPGYSGDDGVRNDVAFAHGGRVDDGFHIYGAIWSPYMIQFYLDDPKNIFFVVTARDVPPGKEWAYNHPFFLILNLAIGGPHSWPGSADASTPNPATMLVDYVRVYKAKKIEGPKMEVSPVTMRTGTSRDVKVKLTSRRGTGRVYLNCLTIAAGVHCSLNPYVVDFTNTETATVSLNLDVQKSPIANADVHIKAFTVSGDESSGVARIVFRQRN